MIYSTRLNTNMDYEQLMNKLSNRINKEYEELMATFKMGGVEECINNAYQIAHLNEVYDLISTIEDWEEEESPFDTEDIEIILMNEDNLLTMVFNSWLNYNHPERYNFFQFEDLLDIVKYAWLYRKED